MSRRTWLALAVLLALVPAAEAADIFPIGEVRPGMTGTGRTVFEGTRVDEFGVRILGVLDNAAGPRRSLILARLDGGPLAETGVFQGMSGSPVFIDGRLVGAVAYSFPFGKEPIAGITPIEEMLDATRNDSPRAASARFPAGAVMASLRAPLDRDALVAAMTGPRGAFTAAAAPMRAMAGIGGTGLVPLALPLAFSGFDPVTFEQARGLFAQMGFAPVAGSAGSAAALGPLPDLEPGAAVGVSLIEGDIDLSATGTITHIDGGRVYAFGHRFYNLGPTQFPMKKAYVYSVFPSLQVSFEFAAAVDAVGTVDQDRSTAIAGHLGAAPRMIPVNVTLRSERRGERQFHFRLVDDELFTPVLAYLSVLSVLQGHERAFGAATLDLDARMTVDGDREVRLADVLAAEQPAQRAAALVAGPLALLVGNDFEKVEVEKVDVTVDAREDDQSATIVRAWVDHDGRLQPGSEATLRVQLRTHRGALVTKDLPLQIPQSAAPGTYQLLVSDAATMNALEQGERQQPFAPRDFDQLVRALNTLRSGSHLYARLTRPAEGAIVAGEYLPSLPGSVLSVLQGADQGAGVVPIRTADVWHAELATDHALSGARRLTLTVER
jgi:hypothetical protein